MKLQADSFRYRCDWQSRASRPGHHRSALTGSGFEMRENALFQLGEDPRRIDLRYSARDPLQRLWVRRMQHRSTATVHVLADLSGSMAQQGEHKHFEPLLQFIVATARSASVNGDKFALDTADALHRTALCLQARRRTEIPAELLHGLHQHVPSGSGCAGMLAAAKAVGGRRALVFLVSDFYWPDHLIRHICAALSHVQLVPVLLYCPSDAQAQPTLLSVYQDAETGKRRLSLQTPRQARRSLVGDHRQRVEAEFMRAGKRVLRLEDGFDANSVSAYFYP